MRTRTTVGLLVVCLVLAAAVGYAVTSDGRSGQLTERWVSNTPRDTTVNHHAVGVGPDGRIVVAPVAVPADEGLDPLSCALVRLAPADGTARWRVGVPPEECGLHALTQPVIAEVDGDASREVVYASTERALHVLDARTGTEETRISLPSFGYAPSTVTNLTGSATPELLAVDIDGNVVLARPNGSVVWRRSIQGSVWYPPRVVDLDGDGTPEVVVGTNRNVVALDRTGRILWRVPGDATEYTTGQADDDRGMEVFASGYASLRAIDGDGEVLWRRDVDGNPAVFDVGDGDVDGTEEVYVGVSPGRVLALSAPSGTPEWSLTVLAGDGRPMPPPVLADVGGSDRPEVIAVTTDGTVTVLDPATGAELAADERDVPVYTYPTVADLDGDGDGEILVRYGDGRVVALDYAERTAQ